MLDRQRWAAGQSYAAYGVRFGLRASSVEAFEAAVRHLPLGWTPTPDDEVDVLYSLAVLPKTRGKNAGYCRLYCGSTLVARTVGLHALFVALEKHSELLTAERAQGCLFVHSGVVSWRGQAILIPGRSMAGKSTLVRALVEAGAVYYSDEYAVLDREGRVHPYPVPLSIRGRTGTAAQKIPVESLNGRVGVEPVPVGLVMVTEYRPGATWRPRTLSPGRALLCLMSNTVAARREPALALAILKQVVSASRALGGRRGEAAAVARALFGRLAHGTVRRAECRRALQP
jgi:hypothetical protein